MNLVELDRALRKLRLSGMAAVLETRLRQAQTEKLAAARSRRRRSSPTSCCADRTGLLERRHKQAGFRDRRSLARHLRFRFQQEDESRARSTTWRPAASSHSGRTCSSSARQAPGKSHLAQAIGRAAIQQGYRVIYREAHTLLEETRRRRRSTAPAKAYSPISRPCRC